MKKYLILSLIFLPFVASASFDKDLYYGLQKEPQVQELQEFLTEQGVYSGPITGNFFSLTLAAVKNFQIANSISPAIGYFGPKTREKANQILAAKGVSSTGVTNESGSTTAVITIPPKTTNDVVASLQDQIKLLQQQLAAIQQQQQTLQTIQQQQASTTQQIAQQTQTLQQIQQNTAPPPAPILIPTPVIQEVKKELRFTTNGGCGINPNNNIFVCNDIEVQYLENGERTNTSVTISSNDNGKFTTCDCNSKGESATPPLEGNPLTGVTYRSGSDGMPSAFFAYFPNATGTSYTIDLAKYPDGTKEIQTRYDRILMATANGITKTLSFSVYFSPPVRVPQ